MVGICENVKVSEVEGGGGIRIGATGKVSALMMQELDSKTLSKRPEIRSRRIQTAPVSISCGSRLQPKNDACNQVRQEKNKKTKKKKDSTQKIPMLDSEEWWMDKTPIRQHKKKVGQRIVETVDLKCEGNQLRRLGFSKISD